MTDQDPTTAEINSMIETVDVFTKMLFCKNFHDTQAAMKCAKNVEDIYSALKLKNLDELFVENVVKRLNLYNSEYACAILHQACDVLLESVLTSTEVQTLLLLKCISEYLHLCGKERFNQVVSKIIVRSEACRVFLDFIETTRDDSVTSIAFQARLLFRTLSKGENERTVLKKAHDWLNSGDSLSIVVAFQAISSEESDHPVSKALIKGLTTILEDRRESALLYWSTVMSHSICLSVLKNSVSLFYASLDFLSRTAENFYFSSKSLWVSQESGPCREIGFEAVVKYLKCLINFNCEMANLVHSFLNEKCSEPGCILWEDVRTSLLQ